MTAAGPGAAKTVGQLLAAKEIVIACGPGGVGKTTTAAALGGHGRGASTAAGCWCSPSTRRGGWPTRWG